MFPKTQVFCSSFIQDVFSTELTNTPDPRTTLHSKTNSIGKMKIRPNTFSIAALPHMFKMKCISKENNILYSLALVSIYMFDLTL